MRRPLFLYVFIGRRGVMRGEEPLLVQCIAVTKWQAATRYEVTFDLSAWRCSVTVGAGGWT